MKGISGECVLSVFGYVKRASKFLLAPGGNDDYIEYVGGACFQPHFGC